MLIIALPPHALKLSTPPGIDYKWVYLGADIRKRDKINDCLGASTLLRLEGRLHSRAERLRQPFLDLVARIGGIQTDPIGWWSSAFSWKVCGASDLFLLVCYEHLVAGLLRDFRTGGQLLIVVVEDPWLFHQLRGLYGDDPAVEFRGAARLWAFRGKSLLLCVVKRGWWALKLLRTYILQRWYWRDDKDSWALKGNVAIYADPVNIAFSGVYEWHDPVLGHLDRLLNGLSGFTRFCPPDSVGFEKEIARRKCHFFPLILWLTLGRFLHSLTACWQPAWPISAEIEGLPIDWLMRREWWADVGRASLFTNRLFLECMRAFLAGGQWRVVVYPYENRPWEKMIALAAAEYGVKTVGYQHGGGMPRFMLSYFHGAGEAEREPLADIIMTSGPYSHRVLAEGGTPSSRLVMAGSWRHSYLTERVAHANPNGRDATSLSRVLVLLPITGVLVQHLLAAIQKAFPDGGRSDRLRFLIKPHPFCPVAKGWLGFDAEIVNGAFLDAVSGCAVVLYTGSSSGMEALIAGRKVLRYRSELLLNIDHGEMLEEEKVPTCGDRDLRYKLLDLVKTLKKQHTVGSYSDDLLGQVFAPLDEAVWLKVFRELLPTEGVSSSLATEAQTSFGLSESPYDVKLR